MAIRRRCDEIVSVESVNPEDSADCGGYFVDVYHHLLTFSWPFLLLQIGAAFFLMNVLFAVGYYLDGGIENARKGSFANAFFFSIETMAIIS